MCFSPTCLHGPANGDGSETFQSSAQCLPPFMAGTIATQQLRQTKGPNSPLREKPNQLIDL